MIKKLVKTATTEEREDEIMKKQYITVITLCIITIALLLTGCMPQNEESGAAEVQISTAGNSTVPDNPEQNTDKKDGVEPQVENPYGIDPAKPMVALTFDDGPSQYTWDIVSTLQSYKARATFFIIGNQVATHEAAIDYILANHNEIASHSFGHKNLTKLSDVEVVNQIRPVDTALLEQHDYIPVMYRVPYGSRDERVLEILKQEGKPVIGWSVDPYDWKVKDKEIIVNHVLNSVKDGDIVLMHDIYEPTAQAVAELIPALQERGYQIVTISELFQFRGVTPEPGVYYKNVPPVKASDM
jgi:peptidoglycan/xylan/chitin deacetylase (PgdA/CDA1 family)